MESPDESYNHDTTFAACVFLEEHLTRHVHGTANGQHVWDRCVCGKECLYHFCGQSVCSPGAILKGGKTRIFRVYSLQEW